MRYSISELANLFGISVRTLHYYDEIGLLPPTEVTEAGYRFYEEGAVATLEQVLFYRELQFSLREIIAMLRRPDYDRTAALCQQRELLRLKQRHLEELLAVLEETIGGTTMKNTPKTTWEELEAAKAQYAEEARRRFGETEEYKVSEQREKSRTPEEGREAAAAADEIFTAFAAARGQAPASPAVQSLVLRWQEHISRYYYPCTKAILGGLGQMYQADLRFAQNIDRFGEGTARLMSEAIRIFTAE